MPEESREKICIGLIAEEIWYSPALMCPHCLVSRPSHKKFRPLEMIPFEAKDLVTSLGDKPLWISIMADSLEFA